ncbi:transcription repressor NadR [Pseudoramibacter sp.]|jgi:transcriptional regulator of NAD metabolism|uniref:transcription repressor NadR n=1 Tax=Pseudoramibacter sp. TaxID=2034862 RepID=UPI0025FBF3E6|nr:transcription repressor NadR [Pseudoramibacter sp.]MCH4073033.1 transcription repressor NadR [Pseudoramibacter sp.]MCH4106804.1 transcription repressor NadR [Pseudoramibacter sp.]
MKGEARRKEIFRLLQGSDRPISGSALAKRLSVSRQVIVQDIALMRQGGTAILSTTKGYAIQSSGAYSRVFKVRHSDEKTEEELNTIVDLGGRVEDVFVYHRVYGILRANLNIRSRLDVQQYLKRISDGSSTLLKNTTSGYHYHTVSADSKEILDLILKALNQKGFLAKLQDYEPVDFWAES